MMTAQVKHQYRLQKPTESYLRPLLVHQNRYVFLSAQKHFILMTIIEAFFHRSYPKLGKKKRVKPT